MTENKPNPDEKKSVRLSLRFWSYVKDEQVRIRKEVGGREPPQEDVADQILDDAISYRGARLCKFQREFTHNKKYGFAIDLW